jgi:CBS-domain-containing membrane protein
MPNTMTDPAAPRLTLDAAIAADLMTDNPVSLRSTATVPEATALLADRGFSAAPVIDDTGRPVGVVSKADVLIHDRELSRGGAPAEGGAAFIDTTSVEEIMTPAVFSVPTETPAAKVVEEMVKMNVHQLFVVDDSGTLVGIISALDVLRHLHAG